MTQNKHKNKQQLNHNGFVICDNESEFKVWIKNPVLNWNTSITRKSLVQVLVPADILFFPFYHVESLKILYKPLHTFSNHCNC